MECRIAGPAADPVGEVSSTTVFVVSLGAERRQDALTGE
jgi:hypothetical protein